MKKAVLVAAGLLVLGGLSFAAMDETAPKADDTKAMGDAMAAPAMPAPMMEPPAADPNHINNKYCPIDGNQNGTMGAPVEVEYKGKFYQLCCKDCAAEFQKDPDQYIKKIDEMNAAEEKKDSMMKAAGETMDKGMDAAGDAAKDAGDSMMMKK